MFSGKLMKRWLFYFLQVNILLIGGMIGNIGQAQSRAIEAVWANDGGDKVTQDELRAFNDPTSVLNSVWDGETIRLFGARNEIISFNLILEAPATDATDVSVSFDTLVGADGTMIQSELASGDGLFDWTNRPIELFYVRYLEIKGLSLLSYQTYDERHIPERMRRPISGESEGIGTWEDRPDHNKFYPDIAVPLELETPFAINAGQNQSIWVDIYIPKETPSGSYTGQVTIQESGTTTQTIPVELDVKDFTLADTSTAKTMLYIGYEDINRRYLGDEYPDDETAINSIRDQHFLLAHRHRIPMIGDELSNWGEFGDMPHPAWMSRLDGSLFTPENGYAGPGVGVGNGIYSIGTYGGWEWQDQGEAAMHEHSDGWVTWFDANAPDTEYFLYLIDESDDYPQIEQWTGWVESNPGPGNRLPLFATLALPDAANHTPNLNIAASWSTIGRAEDWQRAADTFLNDPDKQAYLYNGERPGSGSFAIEDDGIALRELAWGQYKKGIDRWFFWEGTYYHNFQGNTGQTNVFQTAHTFGGFDEVDAVFGETGWNYSNGDGVLFYPGTDLVYPEASYGVFGPFASLRMKHWRRGIQDVEYLVMAQAINLARVQEIINDMIPTVLWENGVEDPNDPSWVLTDISWSTDPDVWEAARAELASIIEMGT